MAAQGPDVSEIAEQDLPYRPFPSAIPPDYRIIISKSAYQTIREHGDQNAAIEICGVVVGDVYKDGRGAYLQIVGAIRGEHAETTVGQVTFTHDTWTHISNVKDMQFPKERIVGWYHSHPGFGIFLSPQDLFIHGSFFSEPWQVAFVVDPLSREEGFFIWDRGKPFQVPHFWIDGDIHYSAEKAVLPEESIRLEAPDSKQPRSRFAYIGFSTAFLLLLLIIAIGFVNISRKIDSLSVSEPVPPVSSLEQGVIIAENLKQIETDIKRLLEVEKSQPPRSTQTHEDVTTVLKNETCLSGLDLKAVRQGGQVWCRGEVSTNFQKNRAEELLGELEGAQSVDMREVMISYRYVVKPGDTLTGIAYRLLGDAQDWRTIFEANRAKLKDPNAVHPSTILILPR